MNTNYNYLTAILRSILTHILLFPVLFTIFQFDLEKFLSKIKNIHFSTRNLYILSKNTSKYCSRINVVVHVHSIVFSKVHPACFNIVNGIKLQSNSKKTDKHAADCSKAVCWA